MSEWITPITWLVEKKPELALGAANAGAYIGNRLGQYLKRSFKGKSLDPTLPKSSFLRLDPYRPNYRYGLRNGRFPAIKYFRRGMYGYRRRSYSSRLRRRRKTIRFPYRKRFPASRMKRSPRLRLRMKYKFKKTLQTGKYPTIITRKHVDTGCLQIGVGVRNRGEFDSPFDTDLSALGPYMSYLDPVTGVVNFNPFSVFTAANQNYRIQFRFQYYLMVRARGQVPVKVILSRYSTVSDHSITRTGKEDFFLANQGQLYGSALGTAPVYTQPCLKAKDSDDYAKDTWKLTKRKARYLGAQGMMSMTMASDWVTFNLQQETEDTDSYQKQLRSQVIFMEVHGAYGSSSNTASEVGYLAGSVNYYMYKTLQIRYDGNYQNEVLVLGGNTTIPTAWTGVGTTPLCPMSDNISYSWA